MFGVTKRVHVLCRTITINGEERLACKINLTRVSAFFDMIGDFEQELRPQRPLYLGGKPSHPSVDPSYVALPSSL